MAGGVWRQEGGAHVRLGAMATNLGPNLAPGHDWVLFGVINERPGEHIARAADGPARSVRRAR